jgi:D-arabinonate dehydratase/D-galactarolactone cycloisomerase
VRVTAENGLCGWGEITPMAGGNASLELLNNFAYLVVGNNALDTRLMYERIFADFIKLGPDGAVAGARAAVDVALWDLKGKILGQPIYQLLGGARSRKLPFYASIGGNARRSIDDLKREIEAWLSLGPALVKIRLDGDKTLRDTDLSGDIAKARAVRQLVGDDFPLAFDANNTYSTSGAIRVGRALEELGYTWFEEPVAHLATHSFEKICTKLDVPVAAGEQEYSLRGIKTLLDAGVSILQPDIAKTGGFTGLLDMAALIASYGADFVPHQTQPLLANAANLHFVAALPNSHHPCEFNDRSFEQNHALKSPVTLKDGCFELSDAPGLGLQWDEAILASRLKKWK